MKKYFVLLFWLFSSVVFAGPNSEVYVTVQSDDPTYSYREGQKAGFSIFEVSPWIGLLEVEIYHPDALTPLVVSNMGSYFYAQTDFLEYGPSEVKFMVYETDLKLLYLLKNPKRNLLETFEITFDVLYDDSTPPTLSVLPEADTVFIDDMPFLQVSYEDQEAGVDINTFKAYISDDIGPRTEITNLFTVTATAASVQFDDLNKLPAGIFFLEVEIADNYENTGYLTARYQVELPIATSGYFVGKVVNPNSNPVSGVEVQITSGGVLNTRTSVTTDEEGIFRLPVGQGGQVLLSATKENWTIQTKWAYGELGKDTAIPTFVLTPLDVSSTFIDKVLGGIARNDENTVEFHVAPNSASDDIFLNITRAKANNELPGPLPILTEFTFMGTMGPSGTQFSPPGKLRIKNDLGFPPNTPIVVGMFNHETGVWEDSGSDGLVTPDGAFVEYDMHHFSSWDANQPVVPPANYHPTVTPQVKDYAGTGCEVEGCRIDAEKGNLGIDYSLPSVKRFGSDYSPTFTYWSQSAKPMIFGSAEQTFKYLPVGDLPDLIQVDISLGKVFKKMYFKGKGSVSRGDTVFGYRMLLDAKDTDGQFVPTGVYDYSMNVGNDYENSRFATALYFGAPPLTPLDTIAPEPVSLKYSVNSRAVVINSRSSAFGKGWTMQGLEKLTPATGDRVVWEDGSGKSSLYTGVPLFLNPIKKYKSLDKSKEAQVEIKSLQTLESQNVTSVLEKSGLLYVADCEGNQVRAIFANGRSEVVVGTGRSGFSGDNGPAHLAELACPTWVSPSNDGGLFIADKKNGRIRKVSKNGIITTVAGKGLGRESSDGGAARESYIGEPTFVSQDKLHSIHFITGNKVRYVDPRGRLATLVAAEGAYYKADLNEPTQMLYDDRDNPIIVDTGNNRIVTVFMQSGDVRVLAGSIKASSKEKISLSQAQAAGTELRRPISFVRDSKGQMDYILDESGSIHVLAHDGRLLKSDLKTNYKNLVLSKNLGLLGVKGSKNGDGQYVSAAGDTSELIALVAGGWKRTEINGNTSFFDENGRVISKTTPAGHEELFTYDTKGRLSLWTIPGGDSFQFSYDVFSGRLKEVTDPVGRVTKFKVNGAGQLTEIENPLEQQRKYAYSPEDLLISETDEANNTREYAYSKDGLLKEETYPDGSKREWIPVLGQSLINDIEDSGTINNPAELESLLENGGGQRTSAEGRTWNYTTDNFGRVTRSIDGLGRVSVSERNIEGRVIRSISPLGAVTSFSYNSSGLVSSIYDPMGRTRNIGYTNFGKVSSLADAKGVTNLTYDSFGNLTEVSDSMNRKTEMQYLAMGLLEKITDHLQNESSFGYDLKGNLATVMDSLGRVSTFMHNNAGQLSSFKDALNRETTYQYDLLNRVTKISAPDGGETTISYSPTGKISSIKDAKNQQTNYFYNNLDQLVQVQNADGKSDYFVYDKDGLLLMHTMRGGEVVLYSYDAASQLVSIQATEGNTNFSYDKDGNVISIGNKDSNIYRSYHKDGQIRQELQSGYGVAYEYSNTGKKQKLTTSNGSVVNYGYNARDIVTNITGSINGGTFVWTRTLDELYRPLKDVLPNGVEVNRSFNELSQLISIENLRPDSSLVSGFDYDYNHVGRRIQVEENQGHALQSVPGIKTSVTDYTYDVNDRLLSSSQPAESFAYDLVGNRQYASGATYNVLNQLLTDGWKYTYEYSDNGNLIRRLNLLTGEDLRYLWDSFNQLKGVQKRESSVLKLEVLYTYDGLGRRISKTVMNHADSSKSYGRKFYYDGAMLIEEQNLQGQSLAKYLNGPGIDEPIMVSRSEGNFVFTKDGLGSVRELIKDNGTPVQRYKYSSFGVTSQELLENRTSRDLVENRYAFTGRELEQETGMYYYRARYYDPEIGRFISEDPIGFAGGDVNLYGYVGNDPVNWIDPIGLDRRKCSRRLNSVFTPIKAGKLRHDYVQFRDSKGNMTTKSWGNKGMIDESGIDTSTRSCGDWEKSSDKADQMAEYLADNLNDLMDYGGATGYNCQDYSDNVFNFQRGR